MKTRLKGVRAGFQVRFAGRVRGFAEERLCRRSGLVGVCARKTDKPLPRILYYGDSISMGYGSRFDAFMQDKAYQPIAAELRKKSETLLQRR